VVVLAVAAAFHLPSEPIFLLFGIDQFMDMVRTSVNVLGNCLATVVIARWEAADRSFPVDESSEGDFMMKLQTQGEDDCPSPRSRSDDYHALAFRAFLRQQCHKCPIHGRELAFLVDGKAQQVRIGHLLVTLQPSLERLNGLDEADLIRPEPMGGVIQIGTQKFHCFLRGYRIGRKRRIRNDSHESGLGERAGCPSLVGIPVEPMLRLQVSFMGGPKQRDQDIHV
jgi:Sodium:dicarboxylate symporter family